MIGKGKSCKYRINLINYMLDMERTHVVLNLPEEYIPLDNFGGKLGFFIIRTQMKLGLGLGQQMEDFLPVN